VVTLDLETLSLAFLAMVCVGGIAWVFLYPMLSGERKADQRRENVTRTVSTVRTNAVRSEMKSRREQVEETLKDIDERNKKAKSVPIAARIEQAGLTWSKQQFFILSGILGAVSFVLTFVVGVGIFPALGIGFAGAFGLPRWVLTFLKKRRENRFIEGFPDAVDVIVRGIKAGLPLLDSMKVIIADASEPLKSEFRAIVETQAVGMPLGEACGKLYERVPIPEANFFGIVISVQQKAGGNLSEALGNLSKVLRERKKMKNKIQAMSQEAKASAAIIAALPIAVMLLVYITSPNYIELLWTTSNGRMMLGGCAFWMTMGVLVMRKMINFDF